MAATVRSRRQAQAVAERQAAKARRQKVLAAGGVGLLVLLLAYEVPHTLKLLNKSSSPAAPVVAPTVTTTAPDTDSAARTAAYRAAMRQPAHDVFAPNQSGSPTTLGSVATPPGLHDPFAKPGTSAGNVAPVTPTAPAKVPTLPGTIVLGTPGAGKVQEQGWIVILASIPTNAGESSATSFAAQAGKAGVGSVKVLNSSNRRPLRGGYWVVYTGPYSSLGQVTAAAGSVHGAGFRSAYIRELIVYKQKPGTTATAKKHAATKTTKKKK